MLDYMLSDIIAVLIHNETGCAGVKFFENVRMSRLRAVFEKSLDDATAVGVRCQWLNLTRECVDDEANVFRGDAFNRLLNYVVAILVLDALENLRL
jgi:hypothetical protein